ncbi:MAG: hypothetical protein KBC33_00455 [Candidatus Pacebacteria bacterium]|nr:hypothetical protein [Candidatus Paceibacterota bacterium]
MKTIILSAFTPYGNYPHNSTQIVAQLLDGKTIGQYRIKSIIFKACIPAPGEDRGIRLLNEALELKAHCIISLGMASQKKGLTIETCTFNRVDCAEYCLPEINGTRIDTEAAYDNELKLDLAIWDLEQFRHICSMERLRVDFSNNPGGFCCNHLMYQLQSAQIRYSRYSHIPWIYFHVPCSPECVPEPIQEFRKAGKVTMEKDHIVLGLELLLSGARFARH